MTLTPREQQIIKALGEGKTLKEIASEMDLEPGTVRVLVRQMRKEGGYRTTEEMMWHRGLEQGCANCEENEHL